MKPTRLVVAAAQMKFLESIAGNLSWIREAIHSSAKAGVEVILFPECAVTGYNRDIASFTRREITSALEAVINFW